MAFGSSIYGSSGFGVLATFVTQIKTFTLDLVLSKTFSKTFQLDAFLVYCVSPGGEGTTIRYNFPFTINAALQKNVSSVFTLDAKLTKFKNFDINAALQKNININNTLDAFIVYATAPVHQQKTLCFSLDVRLIKNNNSTFNLDAKLIRFINFEINSYLQKNVSSNFSIDAFIVYNTGRCPGVASDDITTGTIYNTDGIKNW